MNLLDLLAIAAPLASVAAAVLALIVARSTREGIKERVETSPVSRDRSPRRQSPRRSVQERPMHSLRYSTGGWISPALLLAMLSTLVSLLLGVGVLSLDSWRIFSQPEVTRAGIVGGCEPFQLYAQNNYTPTGTIIRAEPNPAAPEIGSYYGNFVVSVDGWVNGEAPYPANKPPYDSSVWFHVVDGGWVSFAGVRSVPTRLDPTEQQAASVAAPTTPSCEGRLVPADAPQHVKMQPEVRY